MAKEAEITKQLIKTIKAFDKVIQTTNKSLMELVQTLEQLAKKGDNDAK
jgi:hypothetical protein